LQNDAFYSPHDSDGSSTCVRARRKAWQTPFIFTRNPLYNFRHFWSCMRFAGIIYEYDFTSASSNHFRSSPILFAISRSPSTHFLRRNDVTTGKHCLNQSHCSNF
ncbi:hypothetical protein PMAYCL1PPCAC_15166, partial [Pristionchus mayeri]